MSERKAPRRGNIGISSLFRCTGDPRRGISVYMYTIAAPVPAVMPGIRRVEGWDGMFLRRANCPGVSLDLAWVGLVCLLVRYKSLRTKQGDDI